MQLMVFKIMIT